MSCGCLAKEKIAERNKNNAKHNLYDSRQYKIWTDMKSRCNNPSHKSYKNYGARGIRVCDRWEDFLLFWEDMADTYEDHLSIDRIDNDDGYYKENCRWATRQQQINNRRNTIYITYNNIIYPMSEFAKQKGLKYDDLKYRIEKYGMINDEILEEIKNITRRNKYVC